MLALVAFQAQAQSAAGHEGGDHIMLVPADLKWTEVPSLPPGAQIAVMEGPMNRAVPITARLRFPANYRIPAHSHSTIEHVTVLSGTFHMGTGDRLDTTKTKAFGAGGFVVMPANRPHFAWTLEETVIQLHSVGPWSITYVNPADDPRKK